MAPRAHAFAGAEQAKRWHVYGAIWELPGRQFLELVREPAAGGDWAALEAIRKRGDICDRACLAEPMDGVEGFFHLAACVRFGASLCHAVFATNLIGTDNVLGTTRDLSVEEMAYPRTVVVFSTPKEQKVPSAIQSCWARAPITVEVSRLASKDARWANVSRSPDRPTASGKSLKSPNPSPVLRRPDYIPGPRIMRSLAALTNVGAPVTVPPGIAAETPQSRAGTIYIGKNCQSWRELGFGPRPLEAGRRETLQYEMGPLEHAGQRVPW